VREAVAAYSGADVAAVMIDREINTPTDNDAHARVYMTADCIAAINVVGFTSAKLKRARAGRRTLNHHYYSTSAHRAGVGLQRGSNQRNARNARNVRKATNATHVRNASSSQ